MGFLVDVARDDHRLVASDLRQTVACLICEDRASWKVFGPYRFWLMNIGRLNTRKQHIMLDKYHGLDPPDIKLRAAMGFDATDFFVTG